MDFGEILNRKALREPKIQGESLKFSYVDPFSMNSSKHGITEQIRELVTKHLWFIPIVKLKTNFFPGNSSSLTFRSIQ